MKKIRLATIAKGVQEFIAEDALGASLLLKTEGYTPTGFSMVPMHVAEIRGMPIFKELCGPMYDGDGWVRYEDAETNRVLSM
jgi:hypothetical protein